MTLEQRFGKSRRKCQKNPPEFRRFVKKDLFGVAAMETEYFGQN